MLEPIYQFFTQFPAWLATFLLAMLPITELRGSIPFAIGFFKMNPWLAFGISILGDIVPAILIVWFLKPVADWLSSKFKFFERLFNWWFNRVMKTFEKKYLRYGAWALMIFVAIPLPITGAWTGSVASFLFEIPRKRAILFIGMGVIISGIIVTLVSIGAFAIF
ncbi:small multi-drug export protein [Candidatus Kuenenbacteria bacterium]|nr:small multi-drug export protein [Candidatus Kuenenbacteria bacterium]